MTATTLSTCAAFAAVFLATTLSSVAGEVRCASAESMAGFLPLDAREAATELAKLK